LAKGWLDAMQTALAAAKTGEDRVAAGIRMFRELVATPEFNAFLELTIAARTDDDLRRELLALRTSFIATAEAFSRVLFADLAAASPDFGREFRAGIHFLEGLALSHTITRDPRAIDDQLRFLFTTRLARKRKR
jgi:hypothetical protein